MALKTLFSYVFCLAAFVIKFILFSSLNMLTPTNGVHQHVQTMGPTMKTEEPGAGGMETEELPTIRLVEYSHRGNNRGHCGKVGLNRQASHILFHLFLQKGWRRLSSTSADCLSRIILHFKLVFRIYNICNKIYIFTRKVDASEITQWFHLCKTFYASTITILCNVHHKRIV